MRESGTGQHSSLLLSLGVVLDRVDKSHIWAVLSLISNAPHYQVVSPKVLNARFH